MLSKDERKNLYREAWTGWAPVLTGMDKASIDVLVQRLNPWVQKKSLLGYQYEPSTPRTRALFACAKWWLFCHETRQHTTECKEQYRSQLDLLLEVGNAIDAFERAHPHYCRHCGAAGMFYSAGTRDEPPGADACENCVGTGHCPRCGMQHSEEWEGESCECGYDADAIDMVPSYDAIDLECACGGY